MRLQCFSSRSLASQAAADWASLRLSRRLESGGPAGLVVSGGSTPKDCLKRLSKAAIDWSQVAVSLTDERCVPVDDDASNERMVRECLLRNAAEEAVFHRVGAMASEHLACSVVGMGEDGHFASIFPDNPDLDSLLDVDAQPSCHPVLTASSRFERQTVNLAFLLESKAILLLAFGPAKREIIDDPRSLPVAGLLHQVLAPVDVYWAS